MSLKLFNFLVSPFIFVLFEWIHLSKENQIDEKCNSMCSSNCTITPFICFIFALKEHPIFDIEEKWVKAKSQI